jgi:general stress protein YciG
VAPENRSFSRNRELAIEAGRKGGAIAQERRRAAMKEAKCDI